MVDIQDPPEAQSARASPDPHDEEYLEARPNQEEMEDAINKFLVQLEKQERNGFKDLESYPKLCCVILTYPT